MIETWHVPLMGVQGVDNRLFIESVSVRHRALSRAVEVFDPAVIRALYA